ncbi:endonuclease [Chryseobacterium gwangjuense]|uniref:endonuclease n=1 Tax=Chryseobacterium gwangjuense TaxID=1069980 RepID=UPI001E645B55|nr:endonuclease [Chryseobacterium gwangjuense]MCE3074440.1 endonuclease [Chryseobacterium gwangjuense]
MKKLLLPIFLISSYFAAQAPAGYYNGTTGLSGYALKSKLHDIISSHAINWHYGDLQNYYNQTDLDKYYDHGSSNTTLLLDIYSEIPTGPDAYEYTSAQLIGSASTEGLGWNREHMIPQSTFSTGSISDYPMYSDLFYVIPADARINQLRSNYPYGMVGSTIYYTFTNGSKIGNCAIPGAAYTGRVYEPINEFKGDVARSLLYFAVRYEGKLNSFNYMAGTTPANDESQLDGTEERVFEPSYIAMLLQWNQQDPVSQREIDRNNAVYNIQKNRNPFIDNPAWVNAIWSDTPDAIAPNPPTALTTTSQNAYFVNLSWTPSTDTDILGYKIYMNGSATPVATTKNTSIALDHLSPSTSYTFTVKSYDKGYLESVNSNIASATTLSSDSYAKDLIITKYLEGTSDNKALEITNKTGHEVNLNDYRLNIQFYSGTSYYFSDTFELEGTIANNENFVILNPNANLSCYTNAQAKFVTASTPMTYTGSQYVELAYNENIPVDVIGTKGVTNSNGNVSLYRKATVTQPTANFAISEWDSYASNYCLNLGSLSTSDLITSYEEGLKIYPNPANENIFVSGKVEEIQSAQILDFSGKVISTEKTPFKNKKNISVQHLSTGSYLLKLDEKIYPFIKK